VARVRPAEQGERVRIEPAADGLFVLTYEVPALGLRRTATLEPLELSLLRCALGRAPERPAELAPSDADRARVEDVLSRLGPQVPLASVETV